MDITHKIVQIINNKYIVHHNIDDWGEYILLMEKSGCSFARIYWYATEPYTIYFDHLSVIKSMRKQGLGTELQEIREEIGKDLGATCVKLWVKKDTWMHDWYKRRGYTDDPDIEEEDGGIWMKKLL